MNLTTTEWGGALSSFGETYGQDGRELDIKFSFSTFGISMDMALKIFDLNQPKNLKIDVDGIEHLILKGGISILTGVQEVLIECCIESGVWPSIVTCHAQHFRHK